MNTRILSVSDYLDVIQRKKWMILGIVLSALAVGAAICVISPKSYRSSTLITVENQRMPEGYVRGVLTNPAQDRLATIQQLVLSRAILGRVIEEFKLYGENQDVGSVLESMRKRVVITTTREHAFMLSFSHQDPSVAQRATARLADLFIEQNLKTREQLVNEASEFLQGELATAQRELEIKEKSISEFKLDHMGELPGQMEANLRALDRLQAEMTATSETVSRLNERLGQADKAIKEYEAGDMSVVAPTAPGIQPPPRPVDVRLARIKELERNLANLRASYKDTYPDIVHLKQEIAKLKAIPVDDEEAKPSRDEQPANGKALEKTADKKVLDPYYRELLRQRNEIRAELQSMKERQDRIGKEVRLHSVRVERTPMREQQLTSLMRDYDNMQRNYQALLERRLNARMAENLEKRQKGEQFHIIDPAHLPSFPESPDVMKIMLLALMGGCGLGFGTAITLETMRSGFRHGEEVERLLGIPILAEVPAFQTAFGASFRGLNFDGKTPAAPSASRGLLPGTGKAAGNGSGRGKSDLMVLDRVAGVPDINLVMKWRPMSAVAEQYRVAATRLTLMSTSRQSTVVVITSSLKGEGKTSTTLNLGYALAHDLGKRTLIVDCDLKQPKLNVYAGVGADPGLADVLQENGPSISACVRQFDESPLWILPAGNVQSRHVELFKLKRLTALLEDWREQFDFVILDAPPILPLADMNLFAGMADVLALVVRSGDTPTEVVQKAVKAVKPSRQAGIILTGMPANETPYYVMSGYYAASNGPKR